MTTVRFAMAEGIPALEGLACSAAPDPADTNYYDAAYLLGTQYTARTGASPPVQDPAEPNGKKSVPVIFRHKQLLQGRVNTCPWQGSGPGPRNTRVCNDFSVQCAQRNRTISGKRHRYFYHAPRQCRFDFRDDRWDTALGRCLNAVLHALQVARRHIGG